MPSGAHTRALTLGITVLLAGRCAAGSREIDVPHGGRIVGTVRVAGDVAPLPPQPVFKEQETCSATVRDDRLVVDPEGRLEGAVVHLVGVSSGKAIALEPVLLDNRKCAFVPHVAVATVGQPLEIRNDDPFLHDAHAIVGDTTLFNLAVPKGRTVRRVLSTPGIVHINCNVRHTWMHAYVFVTDDPYRAVTDGVGHFALDDVPPGTYTVAVWHELLGSRTREVTVRPDETATVDVELDAVATEKP